MRVEPNTLLLHTKTGSLGIPRYPPLLRTHNSDSRWMAGHYCRDYIAVSNILLTFRLLVDIIIILISNCIAKHNQSSYRTINVASSLLKYTIHKILQHIPINILDYWSVSKGIPVKVSSNSPLQYQH